jgi:dTDP-glucose pyrophosphorylase
MKRGNVEPYISSTPKPLLKVNGVPIIRKIVEKLNSDNINVAIVINPVDEKTFNDNLYGLKFKYYYQNSPKGTADALYAARQFVSDDIFGVFMGDDIFNYDELNLKNNTEPIIFAYRYYDCRNFGVLELDSRGYVRKIFEKEKRGKGLINTGIYVMSKQFFQIFEKITMAPNSNEYYLTEAIPELYKAGTRMRAHVISTWKGINFPSDLTEVNALYNDKPVIRLARLDDFPSLIRTLSQLKPDMADPYFGIPSGLKILEKIIEDENHYLLVAELNNKLVGTATMLVQNNLTHYARPYAHIENVVTDLEYRKRGIGKLLISELINVAKSLDCYKVILNCTLQNSRFYESVGFSLTNEVEMRLDFQHPYTPKDAP